MFRMQLSAIPAGLSHQEYEWSIKNDDAFENDSDVKVHAEFDINNIGSRQYEVRGKLIYTLSFECDRCNVLFEKKFEEPVHFFLKKDYLGDDMDIIPFGDNDVDLTEYLRDVIVTSVPMKKLCREECRGLCPHCGADLNKVKCNCAK